MPIPAKTNRLPQARGVAKNRATKNTKAVLTW